MENSLELIVIELSNINEVSIVNVLSCRNTGLARDNLTRTARENAKKTCLFIIELKYKFCEYLFQPLKPIEQNGPSLHYAVFFRRVKDPSPMTRVQVDADTSKNKLEYTVADTEFYEQFEFQVQAINALGSGPKSAVVYGYSGEKCKSGKIE
jgi:hypothetical protein